MTTPCRCGGGSADSRSRGRSGRDGLVVVSEDVGDLDLDRAVAALGGERPRARDRGARGVPGVRVALPARGRVRCGVLPAGARGLRAPRSCARGGARARRWRRSSTTSPRGWPSHPYRLTHRDFHFNNLFLHEGRVRAVDYQDMRGGPDTYDLASLLGERGAAGLGAQHSSRRHRLQFATTAHECVTSISHPACILLE